MAYQVLLSFAIIFILAGIVLIAITIAVFFKWNMADVYESLLGRKFKGHKTAKSEAVAVPVHPASAPSAKSQTQVTPVAARVPVSVGSAPKSQSPVLSAPQNYNSGNTTFLGQNQGETTPLNSQANNSGFVVTKDITYTYSKETIE